jgi:hypothetical protein
MDAQKAVIAVCAWRQVEVATATCLHKADEAGYNVHYHWNDALISRARSTVASNFLREWSQYDLLVFIDTDIVFDLDTLEKVCDLALEKQAVAVSPYAVRKGKHPWLAFRQLDDGTPIKVGRGTNPVPIKYGATGFMAIPRSILEKMADTLPYCNDQTSGGLYPFFLPMTQEQPQGYIEYLSEDWAFCQRVQDCGMEVWLRSDTSVGHMGVYEFTLADVLKDSAFQTEKDLAAEDLAEYWTFLGRDLPNSWDEGAILKELSNKWKEADPQTPEEVDEFYKGQDAYLIDLVNLNSMDWYWRKVGNILALTGEVADFGGGNGSVSIALARRGCKVHYVELNSPQKDFAVWRFIKHKVPIAVHSEINGLKNLDAIAAVETMEHIHPDALPQYAQQFYDALKPGGQVRTASSFGKSEVSPMHYDTAQQFKEAMYTAGFTGGPSIWVKRPEVS